MGDLYLGCCILAVLAAALGLLTWLASCRLPNRTCDALAVLLVTMLFYYLHELWYDVRLARYLPYANLIVLGNALPLFAFAMAALAWRRTPGGLIRRGLPATTLALCGSFALVYPLLGEVPKCGDRWDQLGTCLQTTPNTCSAACAATLLKSHGITATEQEMAELCLTRHGTSWQGLYRGLKLKTAGTPWDVQVCQCSAGNLRRYREGPMILSVGLARGAAADPEFTREYGWVPGVNHSVILQEFSRSGSAVIIDPSAPMCREQWDDAMVRLLWRGYALRLVPRSDHLLAAEADEAPSLVAMFRPVRLPLRRE